MLRVGLVGVGVSSVVALGGMAQAQGVPCVDMLVLGEPVCEIASGEMELATSADLVRNDGVSAFATGFDLQVALSASALLAVRVETELELATGSGPVVGGVGGHFFGILARSEDGARGIGLAADVLAPSDGAPVAEVGLGATFTWNSVAVSGASGVTAPLAGKLPANAFGTASLAIPMGPLSMAALVEGRVEGGSDPFRVDMAVGLTLHPTESTKLLVAAPVGHGDDGWSAGVSLTFVAGLGSIGGEATPEMAASEDAPVVIATDAP